MTAIVENSEAFLPAAAFPAGDNSHWYAIQTMPRHEKQVASKLQEKSLLTFLPFVEEVHRWSDRFSTVNVPLFSCYVFVRMAANAEERLKVLRTQGTIALVGHGREGTPIPDEEIANLQMAITSKLPWCIHPFITIGDRVRIRGGSLDGMQGILMRNDHDQSLVLSVNLLRQSVAIRIEGYKLELL